MNMKKAGADTTLLLVLAKAASAVPAANLDVSPPLTDANKVIAKQIEKIVKEGIVNVTGAAKAKVTNEALLIGGGIAGADDMFELALSLEEAFGVKFQERKLKALKTVGDLVRHVIEKTGCKLKPTE